MTASPSFRRTAHLALVCCAAWLLLGCDQADGSTLPEWTPADHTNQENPSAGQIDTSVKRTGMEKLEAQGVNDVVFAAWKTNCITCHGPTGAADGPQSAMVRPPDMTSPAWHRTRIDSEMKRAIQKGRGRMPAFPQLPEKTVDGLVRLVRMLNPEFRQAQESQPAGEPQADPQAPKAAGESSEAPAKGPESP